MNVEKLARVLRAIDRTLEEIMEVEDFPRGVEDELRQAGAIVEDLLVPGIHDPKHPMHELDNEDMLAQLGLKP